MYKNNLNLDTMKVCFAYLEVAEEFSIQKICDVQNFLNQKLFDDGYLDKYSSEGNEEVIPIIRRKQDSSPMATVTLITLHGSKWWL